MLLTKGVMKWYENMFLNVEGKILMTKIIYLIFFCLEYALHVVHVRYKRSLLAVFSVLRVTESE